MDLSIAAITRASQIDLSGVAALFSPDKATYINLWPGEQYKLLCGFVGLLKPKLVIEVGTAAGGSALCMKRFLPEDGRIVTYDVIPWQDYPKTGLNPGDFDSRLEQRILDLSDPEQSASQVELLKEADFIFVDAAKDGAMEQAFCDLFESIPFTKPPVIFFDDIRFVTMVEIWRRISHPKMDLTSFGHWSGTGVVDWR
jgi:predicted O-methyltransferase YrrM